MRKTLLLPLALLLAAGAARAQSNGNPTPDPQPEGRDVSKRGLTAANFLLVPVGARASAMGSAITASVDDASSVYWNPSGLARVQGGAFQAEYAQWFTGMDFNQVTVAYALGGGTVAAAVTSLRTADMEETTLEQQDGTGRTFNAASYAFSLAYARQLTDRFSIGGTAKYVSERINVSSAGGLAFDIGTTFVTPLRGVRLGATIANFGAKMQMTGDDLRIPVDLDPNAGGNGTGNSGMLETDRFDMPLTLRIGLAGEAVRTGSTRITLAVDAQSPSNAQQFINVGTEIGLLGDLLMLRGGYNELLLPDSSHGLTLGAGLRYELRGLRLAVDYGWEQARWLQDVNRFTVSVGF
jgi:hypothetical protein